MNEIELLKTELRKLKNDFEDMQHRLYNKTGLGSADIRGKIIQPSTVAATIADNTITQAMLRDDIVAQAELDYEIATVTISAGNPSGTATVVTGSIILGFYPSTNLDQIIDDISVSGTTLTVTLATNATAETTIKVVLLKT